jgi:hypothetical protein
VSEAGRMGAGGPVPARLLGEQEKPAAVAPAGSVELRVVIDGAEWLARPAGAGCYGTGARGTARLLAVHFFRADEPGRPLREALVPAGVFATLRPEELAEVWAGATPIEAL